MVCDFVALHADYKGLEDTNPFLYFYEKIVKAVACAEIHLDLCFRYRQLLGNDSYIKVFIKIFNVIAGILKPMWQKMIVVSKVNAAFLKWISNYGHLGSLM